MEDFIKRCYEECSLVELDNVVEMLKRFLIDSITTYEWAPGLKVPGNAQVCVKWCVWRDVITTLKSSIEESHIDKKLEKLFANYKTKPFLAVGLYGDFSDNPKVMGNLYTCFAKTESRLENPERHMACHFDLPEGIASSTHQYCTNWVQSYLKGPDTLVLPKEYKTISPFKPNTARLHKLQFMEKMSSNVGSLIKSKCPIMAYFEGVFDKPEEKMPEKKLKVKPEEKTEVVTEEIDSD